MWVEFLRNAQSGNFAKERIPVVVSWPTVCVTLEQSKDTIIVPKTIYEIYGGVNLAKRLYLRNNHESPSGWGAGQFWWFSVDWKCLLYFTILQPR